MVATIQDVAKAAGVSKATVSYVINDKPGVSDETRYRVLTIMKDLNFMPNAAARGLAGQSTEMIGLVIPDITDMFYADIVRGVENKANEYGFTLNLCTTHAIPDKERTVTDMFTSGRVDGVILMTYYLDAQYLNKLKQRNVPFVTIDNPIEDDFYSVTVGNEEAGYQATELLLELGHRRIGFIHGATGTMDSKLRYKGFLKALKERGIKPETRLVNGGDFKRDGGYAAALELLRAQEPPTAIFAANDQMALGVIGAANECGLYVPYDLSVIGVDDIEAAALTDPPLTTIKQPIYEMGSTAAQILTELIKGNKPPSRKITLGTELILRGTCAAPRNKEYRPARDRLTINSKRTCDREGRPIARNRGT